MGLYWSGIVLVKKVFEYGNSVNYFLMTIKVLEYCNFDFTGQENICLYYDCVQCTESHVLLVYKVFKYMFTVNWFCWSRIYSSIYCTLN